MTARDRLVFSTIDLVRRHGVAGAGVAEILQHGNVSRRSLYLNFPDGKEGLVAESTRVAGEFIGHQIAAFVDRPTPRSALEAFVGEWRNVVSGSDFSAGCPIAAAALSRTTSPAVADAAGAAFEQWKRTIGESLRRHGLAAATADALSGTIVAAVEGAVVMCIAQRSLVALDDVQSQLTILIDLHLGGPGGVEDR